MIFVEKITESAFRVAIRTAINTAAETMPALKDAKILGYWLDSEDGSEDMQNANNMHVMLVAHPNSAEGYNEGLTPIREFTVDVMGVMQPDDDADRSIISAFYETVRGVFDPSPSAVQWPSGINCLAASITNGGAAEIDEVGQVFSFQVNLTVSI